MRRYQSIEANIKEADTLISMGDKFYWTPNIMLFGYITSCHSENFNTSMTVYLIFIASFFMIIGVSLRNKGLNIYDEIYYKELKKNPNKLYIE